MLLIDAYDSYYCSWAAAHSQLATVEKSTGKKDGKRIQYDWNDAEIKPISEIMDATKVIT